MSQTTHLFQLVVIMLLSAQVSLAQFAGQDYFDAIEVPNKLFKTKKYKEAALAYSATFIRFDNKGAADDRYKAACAWAIIGTTDSAFSQLNRLVEFGKFHDFEKLENEKMLVSLHSDPRWKIIIETAKQNFEVRPIFSKVLADKLKKILEEDSSMRDELSQLRKKYGRDSEQVQSFFATVKEYDSAHLVFVKNVLDSIGWPGFIEVGREGNAAIFLVIQHADSATQRKYLPLLREAVKNHKALPADMALLEDRVLLNMNKKQIYGSQIGIEPETGAAYVLPLEDPDRVDERREKVGLGPMANYLANWKVVWDVEEFKRKSAMTEGK